MNDKPSLMRDEDAGREGALVATNSETSEQSSAAEAKSKRGNFFVIEQEMFHKACALGLRPAVAFLVLARYTGRTGVTSRASSNAIEKYTGIGRGAARDAIAALESAGIVRRSGSRTRPIHKFTRLLDLPDPRGAVTDAQRAAFEHAESNDRAAAQKPLTAPPSLRPAEASRLAKLEASGHVRRVDGRWTEIPRPPGEPVWLPNELIDGVGGRDSPLELIRQTGDALTLRLLIDLYTAHRLDEWHGVDPRIIRGTFDEVYRYEAGPALVLGWTPRAARLCCWWGNSVTDPHRGTDNLGDALWSRVGTLEQLGLLIFVPHVEDGDHAPLYPCSPAAGHRLEIELAGAAQCAATQILETRGRPRTPPTAILAVVPGHMQRAAMVGVARLTFRPKTAATATWLAQLAATHADWMARFASVSSGETKGIAKAPGA